MISRNLFTDVLLIAMLVTLQIFLFNRIDIAGKYTPVIYIIFVLFYPFYRNLYIFLSASFILGLSIDAFLGTWGINAFATTLIAYFRTIIFNLSHINLSSFITTIGVDMPLFVSIKLEAHSKVLAMLLI
jgi:rod shape-determining protein MreD